MVKTKMVLFAEAAVYNNPHLLALNKAVASDGGF